MNNKNILNLLKSKLILIAFLWSSIVFASEPLDTEKSTLNCNMFRSKTENIYMCNYLGYLNKKMLENKLFVSRIANEQKVPFQEAKGMVVELINSMAICGVLAMRQYPDVLKAELTKLIQDGYDVLEVGQLADKYIKDIARKDSSLADRLVSQMESAIEYLDQCGSLMKKGIMSPAL